MFFLVWNPTGNNPSYRHSTEQAAINESRRLASLHPECEFFVLAAVARSKFDAVQTERFGEDLPF